jgi:hypothetical protein
MKMTMNGKVLVVPFLLAVILALTACGGEGVPPGAGGSTAVDGGKLTVQLTQGPPATMVGGASVGLYATVFNDKNNAGVTWSCAPAGACGTFSPGTTGYLIDTLYTAPSLAVYQAVTITATSVADNSQSANGATTVSYGNPILTGSFVFNEFGFTSTANGGEQGSAAGQFTTDGNGNITAGIMDLNAFGSVSSLELAGSTYSISGVPRGTVVGPAGQTYNIYLTDPNLNLLDPNNTSGGGGALLLETDNADTIGVVIPQTNASATFDGSYGILLSDQSNPPNYDGGFTGAFTTSSTTLGTFSGEGDYQGMGGNSATPIVGPLTGTFTADTSNLGRFAGTITTTPALWASSVGGSTPGTETVSYYLANGSQGVVEETDSVAPAFGAVELQNSPVVGTSMLKGQYAFVLEGYGSFGMVGSVILDGNGNVTAGEADGSANGFYSTIPSITGTYTLDATGHGNISLSLNNTSCCGTLQQTHGITATSSSHLVMAEDDQFNGLTIGGVGSMDLQTTAPNFTASQVSGGYSFTLTGYSGAKGANGSWGGIFTADGVSAINGGIFDTNLGGSAGPPPVATYSSTSFTGTFTPPDTYGRGTMDLSNGTAYAYYIVTPEVLRLTTINDTANPTNVNNAGNTGSAFGQGSVAPPSSSADRQRADTQHSHPKNLLQITGEQHGQTSALTSGQAGSGRE